MERKKKRKSKTDEEKKTRKHWLFLLVCAITVDEALIIIFFLQSGKKYFYFYPSNESILIDSLLKIFCKHFNPFFYMYITNGIDHYNRTFFVTFYLSLTSILRWGDEGYQMTNSSSRLRSLLKWESERHDMCINNKVILYL